MEAKIECFAFIVTEECIDIRIKIFRFFGCLRIVTLSKNQVLEMQITMFKIS